MLLKNKHRNHQIMLNRENWIRIMGEDQLIIKRTKRYPLRRVER